MWIRSNIVKFVKWLLCWFYMVKLWGIGVKKNVKVGGYDILNYEMLRYVNF